MRYYIGRLETQNTNNFTAYNMLENTSYGTFTKKNTLFLDLKIIMCMCVIKYLNEFSLSVVYLTLTPVILADIT